MYACVRGPSAAFGAPRWRRSDAGCPCTPLAGKALAGDGKFWRMNRLHGYGGFAWDVESSAQKELLALNGSA